MSLSEFDTLGRLGDGAFSTVYKVKRKSDGKIYALKKVKIAALRQKERENALNEIRILASIDHPNIVKYKEAFIDNATNTLCMIMEYCNDGDLLAKIRRYQKQGKLIPENTLWNYFTQICAALRVLHEMQIFHRDLKCANIFINKTGVVKLGDLNVSKVAKGGLVYTQTGTPYYASPEVWKDRPYDNKSDIWSLGVVMYEAAMQKPPFHANDMHNLYKKIVRGLYPAIPSVYSSDMTALIRSCLQVNSVNRPNCETLLQMNIVKRNASTGHLLDVNENANHNLLSTIRMPRTISMLANCLPRANYADGIVEESSCAQSTNRSQTSADKENMWPRTVRSQSKPAPVIRRQRFASDGTRSRVSSVLRHVR